MPHLDYSAGFVIFCVDAAGARQYLLLKSTCGHWEFPKGHAEPGESFQAAARRETSEETGLTDLRTIPGFCRKIRYLYRTRSLGVIDKTDYFALGQTTVSHVRLSSEHTESAFLNFQAAYRRLTYASTREVLREADEFISIHLSSQQRSC